MCVKFSQQWYLLSYGFRQDIEHIYIYRHFLQQFHRKRAIYLNFIKFGCYTASYKNTLFHSPGILILYFKRCFGKVTVRHRGRERESFGNIPYNISIFISYAFNIPFFFFWYQKLNSAYFHKFIQVIKLSMFVPNAFILR